MSVLVEASALLESEKRYRQLAEEHAKLLGKMQAHEAWLDELVPPVQGGPRLTRDEQRERIANMVTMVTEAFAAVDKAKAAAGAAAYRGTCPGCSKPVAGDDEEAIPEDDESAGLLWWHRPCFEIDAAPAPPDVLHDMLSLVMDGAHPSVDTIAQWTDAQRAEAERWAAHECLIASDHGDVERLPRPLFLAPLQVAEPAPTIVLGRATIHGYPEPGEEGGA